MIKILKKFFYEGEFLEIDLKRQINQDKYSNSIFILIFLKKIFRNFYRFFQRMLTKPSIRNKFALIEIKIINFFSKKKNYNFDNIDLKNIEYLDLPYDSGLSYGRNKAVEKVNTKYTIITDDSRCITDTKQLGNLIKFMDNNEKYDLISGNVLERGKFAGKFTYLFDIDDKPKIMNTINQNDKIKIKIKHKNINDLKIIDNNLKLYKTHIGVNCFIARTTVLKKHKWDNNLKLREHKHFFLNLFLNNINVLYCDKFIFKQFNSNLRKYDMSGLKLRRRNFTNNITFY